VPNTVGHREALLAAARKCLEERGFARTTARDLVAASGTNLGSIGYHFGSKNALLYEAMDLAFAEYVDKVLAAAASAGSEDQPQEAVLAGWETMVRLFSDYRPLLVACVEVLAQSERNPSLRERLSGGYERMRTAVAAAVRASARELDEETTRTIASFLLAVCDGLMVQWLIEPARTPSGRAVFDAARLLFGSLPEPHGQS
jgi:AcrR family transcriptional regulator